jgi:hypothetical protein
MAALRKLWSLRRRRPVFVGTSLAVLAFLVAYPAIHWWLQARGVAGEFRYFDLGAYRAAVNAWQAGDPIYLENDNGGYHGSYLYPPVYLLLFLPVTDVPFADLTFHQAGTLLNVVSLGLLWVGLQAAIAAYGLRLAWVERLLLLWAVAGFAPVIVSMQLAQVSVLLAALLAFALAGIQYGEPGGRPQGGRRTSERRAARPSGSAAERASGRSDHRERRHASHEDRPTGGTTREPGGRPQGGRRTSERRSCEPGGRRGRAVGYASGALTAVAGTLKLIYAPVGAHLLVDRRRFAGAVAAALGLVAVSLAVFGVEAHVQYYDVLTWGKGWGDSRPPFPPNLWLPPYYRPFYYLGSTVGMAIRIGLAAGIILLSLASVGESVDTETFALGVAAIPLIAPRAYTQDLAVFLPVAVALLATELGREDGSPLVPVVGVFLAAVHPYGFYGILRLLAATAPSSSYDVLQSAAGLLQPGVWAAVLFVGLAVYRVGQAAALPPALADR